MTFEQFQASGRDVPDLGAEIVGMDLEGKPGRVYLYEGGPYIERSATGWYLCLGRDEYEVTDEDRPTVERLLYDWCKAERFFEDEAAAPVA
jgi:hypothetical protein